MRLGFGLIQALRVLGRIKPAAIVGFGGYPTIPPVAAGTLRKIPTVIHEQNAVMGRANRMLAPRVTAIATSFAGVLDGEPRLAGKARRTGNPVRAAVIAAAATPYSGPDPAECLRLLVFGGSQGARIMADVVPAAITRLDATLRSRLAVVQQAREEDVARVKQAYAQVNVSAEVAPFFLDLPTRMAATHLVIARAGASTVAELTAIGRPAVLIPLPHALDQDQSANAGVLERAGGAIRLAQHDFTPERLASELSALASAPQKLVAMTAAARSQGALDAAERLADLVGDIMRRGAS
jgi:UDP-N-acetylglucosamine--N-acetylmuramyl-(pentapeptide) pyrophosphoryl-undecaprenol N-acetylglucosamine transferase